MPIKPKQPAKNELLSPHAGLLWMVVVSLLAFTFGAHGLNTDVIWADELTSVGHMGVFDAPASPTDIIASIDDKSSQHMPLYFLLGAGWANFAGWSQYSLRVISLFAGVLMLAWTYRLGADVMNRRTGVIASALFGSSAFMIIYLHEIRMYSLFVMLAVMHTWLYWRIAHDRPITRLTWVLFIATTATLFYTHIFSGVVFAGLGIYHLLIIRKTRNWLNVIIVWGLGAVIFLPYLPTVLKGFFLATNKISTITTAMSTPELIGSFIHLVTNGTSLFLIPLAGFFLFAIWKTRDRRVLRFLVVTLIMFVVLVLINYRFGLVPLRRARYLLILWFPFMMLFAYGLTMLPRWRIIAGIMLVLWGISGWMLYRQAGFLDYIGTLDAVNFYPPMQQYVYVLDGKSRPHDYVLGFTQANFVNRRSKHDKSTADYYMEALAGIDGAFVPDHYDADELTDTLPTYIDDNPFLLLTYDPQAVPENYDLVAGMLADDYAECQTVVDESDVRVVRYILKPWGCDHEYAPITYENGVTIVDKLATYHEESQSVHVLTGWQVANEQLLYEYNVSLQIVTPDWQNVGQTDRHLHDDLLKWYVTDLPVADLPSGDYRVMVIVYGRDTGEKVTGTDLNTGETGTILPIASFTIEG